MPTESESYAPAVAAKVRVFCKGCGYALVGLSSNQCPECGRGFDLGNRRTFARRPPRGWVWRWGRRVLAVGMVLLLAAGAGVGWLWWGWRGEQGTIARLRTLDQPVHVSSIGPERLRWVLGKRLRYLTDRVEWAWVDSVGATETEQLDFRSLTRIQELLLSNCELSNSNLSNLAGLGKLRHLELFGLRIEKPDLSFLEKLPALSKLVLMGKWVPKAGFEHIGRLKQLKVLNLSETGMNDKDLQQLLGLSSLEQLDVRDNPVSVAGLEQLKGLKSLRVLSIDAKLLRSPGVAKLREAIPGLVIDDSNLKD